MPNQPNHKKSRLRISRPVLYGILIGTTASIGFIFITLFQLDREAGTMTADLIISGFAVSLPIGITVGAFSGWLWGRFFGK